jgi:hypothetical protein
VRIVRRPVRTVRVGRILVPVLVPVGGRFRHHSIELSTVETLVLQGFPFIVEAFMRPRRSAS